MASIEDHDYLKLCANLARISSISIASARRKIDLAASKKGVRDIASKKNIAEHLLKEANEITLKDGASASKVFDDLLKALAEEENFMIED